MFGFITFCQLQKVYEVENLATKGGLKFFSSKPSKIIRKLIK